MFDHPCNVEIRCQQHYKSRTCFYICDIAVTLHMHCMGGKKDVMSQLQALLHHVSAPLDEHMTGNTDYDQPFVKFLELSR